MAKINGKWVPDDVYATVQKAIQMADDTRIGYSLMQQPPDTVCQTFCNQATASLDGPDLANGDHQDTEVGGKVSSSGWKFYDYNSVKAAWPGDLVAETGRHVAIVIDWNGGCAEALNSGPSPVEGSEFKITKCYIAQDGDDPKETSWETVKSRAKDEVFEMIGSQNEAYQIETKKIWTGKKKVIDQEATPGYWIRKDTGAIISPWTEANQKKVDELRASGVTVTWHNGQAEISHMELTSENITYYKKGKDGDGDNRFWATLGDQGDEVSRSGNIAGRNWDVLARRVKSWLGIDHFEVPYLGGTVKYKIP